MNLEERIERAAAFIQALSGQTLFANAEQDAREIAWQLVPELFDGTHWLAPMEATEEMAAAEFDTTVEDLGQAQLTVTRQSWRLLRNAYLKEKEPA